MIKIYISVREVNDDGSALDILDNYHRQFPSKEDMLLADLSHIIFEEIEKVEKRNDEFANPL